VGLTIFHEIFPKFKLNDGKDPGIFCGILSVPRNNVIDLNNVMHVDIFWLFFLKLGNITVLDDLK
jgi:hypothetical protein